MFIKRLKVDGDSHHPISPILLDALWKPFTFQEVWCCSFESFLYATHYIGDRKVQHELCALPGSQARKFVVGDTHDRSHHHIYWDGRLLLERSRNVAPLLYEVLFAALSQCDVARAALAACPVKRVTIKLKSTHRSLLHIRARTISEALTAACELVRTDRTITIPNFTTPFAMEKRA